jgi:hypothetical protein
MGISFQIPALEFHRQPPIWLLVEVAAGSCSHLVAYGQLVRARQC